MLLEGGGLPRSPSAPRALLGASARSSARPSHNTCGLPLTNTFRPITLALSHLYSVISHVIPLRLLQTLNLHRWNCNVFPRSRKITVLNYVRNLSGPGLPSPAVIAARPSHNTCGLPPTNTFRPITLTSRCTRSVAIHPIRRGVMPTDRVHRLPQQVQPRALPPDTPEPAASDAATQPRHANPFSEREALHHLGSITPPPSWCNTPLSGVTPLSNKYRCGEIPRLPS